MSPVFLEILLESDNYPHVCHTLRPRDLPVGINREELEKGAKRAMCRDVCGTSLHKE